MSKSDNLETVVGGTVGEAWLESRADSLLKPRTVIPGQYELSSVSQDHPVVSVKPPVELPDSIYLDDPRSTNTQDLTRIQLFLQDTDSLPQQMRPPLMMHPNIVSLGLEPNDPSSIQQ